MRTRLPIGALLLCVTVLAAGMGGGRALGQSEAPYCGTPSENRCVAIQGAGTVTLAPLHVAEFIVPGTGPNALSGSELDVTNDSGIRGPDATVAFDGGNLTIEVADGFVLQLHLDNDLTAAGCEPVDGQVNVARCPLSFLDSAPSRQQVHFSAVDATLDPQRVRLGRNETLLLVQPAASTSSEPPMLRISSDSSSSGSLTWDGTLLTVSVQDGDTVNVTPSAGCRSGAFDALEPLYLHLGVGSPMRTLATNAPTFPGSLMACSLVSGGRISVTTTESPTVEYPGTALLPPGGALRFLPPPSTSTQPGGMFVRYPPQPMLIMSQSDQPATLAYDGRTVEIAVPDGFGLQLYSGGPLGLLGCAPAGDRPNDVTCNWPSSGLGSKKFAFATAALDEPIPSISLPPQGSVIIFGPPADSEEIGSGTSEVLVRSLSMGQSATVTLDGSTLTVLVPEGFLAMPIPRVGPAPAGPPDAGCATDLTQANLLSCVLPGGSSQVSYTTESLPPAGTLVLPYTDRSGSGSLTIINTGPDVTPNGVQVAVTLTRGGTSLHGTGVLRPQRQLDDITLDFSLDDTRQGRLLYQGVLGPDGASWSGTGLKQVLGEPSSTDRWSLGMGVPGAPKLGGGNIWVGSASVAQPPSGPGPPPPAVVGPGEVFDPSAGGIGIAKPPAVGVAGEDITFTVLTPAPSELPDRSRSFQWYFGDGGSTSPTAPLLGERQTATHVYAGPGTYSVSVVTTDSTGISGFSTIEILIAAAQ